MKIKVIAAAPAKQNILKDAEAEYIKRLSKSLPTTCVDLGINHPDSLSAKEAIRIETKEFEKLFKKNPLIISLDENGKQFNSNEFATYIGKLKNQGIKEACFLIGGPFGLSDEIKKQSALSISLSKLTFTHHFSRLILLEQLYRASSILQGSAYHK